MTDAFVHIVDDDQAVRAATSFLLRSRNIANDVYSSGREFLGHANLEKGCVLLDLRMDDGSGMEVLEELDRKEAALPVIVLTGHGDLQAAVRAMKLGAVDFLEKPYEENELMEALERAFAIRRKTEQRSAVQATARRQVEALSKRETEVLQGMAAGLANKVMARHFELSPRTVEMHRARLMDKLGVASLSQAVRIAIDAGLPELEIRPER